MTVDYQCYPWLNTYQNKNEPLTNCLFGTVIPVSSHFQSIFGPPEPIQRAPKPFQWFERGQAGFSHTSFNFFPGNLNCLDHWNPFWAKLEHVGPFFADFGPFFADFGPSRTHSEGTQPLPWVQTGHAVYPQTSYNFFPCNLNCLDALETTKLFF